MVRTSSRRKLSVVASPDCFHGISAPPLGAAASLPLPAGFVVGLRPFADTAAAPAAAAAPAPAQPAAGVGAGFGSLTARFSFGNARAALVAPAGGASAAGEGAAASAHPQPVGARSLSESSDASCSSASSSVYSFLSSSNRQSASKRPSAGGVDGGSVSHPLATASGGVNAAALGAKLSAIAELRGSDSDADTDGTEDCLVGLSPYSSSTGCSGSGASSGGASGGAGTPGATVGGAGQDVEMEMAFALPPLTAAALPAMLPVASPELLAAMAAAASAGASLLSSSLAGALLPPPAVSAGSCALSAGAAWPSLSRAASV